MAAFHGGFNRSMQHTNHCVGRRSVADEVPDTNLLHAHPEGIDVGAMEGRLDASSDRPAVRSTAHVGAGHPVPDGWHSAARTSPLRNGADAGRERRDLARDGGPIDSFDRRTARASAVDDQPRDQAQWRPATAIGQPRQTKLPGIVRFDRSAASWSRTGPWHASWLTSFGCCGRRSKSPGGSSILIRATRAITCHTRPSTAVCSFKRVAP